jgi:tRNA G18 (ribose-2'-O)-methylase SpoU
LELRLLADGVENPANRARIADVAALLGGVCVSSPEGHLIAVENAAAARSVYGRRALRGTATLAVGNERRGLSRAILMAADETVLIPTLSRAVTTLNVAAAAAVAGWYVTRGSGPQAVRPHPEKRRPSVLLAGEDHIEVGSSLRSAAAFGFREVFLEDRGEGWFGGEHHRKREARAAARRHKNPLRVQRGSIELAERFEEVVVITSTGPGTKLSREQLTRGRRQLVVIGMPSEDVTKLPAARVRVASLSLETAAATPLRIVASIALAEIARQVGQPAARPREPASRGPRYNRDLKLVADGEMLLIEPDQLLDY